jgi:hypothetical protein
MAQTERALLSTVSVEDYVHDALHLVELNRVQDVGHLDMSVAVPLDRDDQLRGTKINQLEAVVADVTMVVRLDVASPLNDEIGAVQPKRISDVIARIFGLQRNLIIYSAHARTRKSAGSFLMMASIRFMVRRLCRA